MGDNGADGGLCFIARVMLDPLATPKGNLDLRRIQCARIPRYADEPLRIVNVHMPHDKALAKKLIDETFNTAARLGGAKLLTGDWNTEPTENAPGSCSTTPFGGWSGRADH